MLFKKLFRRLTEKKWNIGFIFDGLDQCINGELPEIRWLKHNFKDRWFADPFILSVTAEEIVVLVEEMFYPIGRGRIAKLTIDKKTMSLKRVEPVLTVATHLSFPVIARMGDQVFIYPENGASGGLDLYRYDVDSNSILLEKRICNEKLGDAVITSFDGVRYMFCTVFPNYNGDELWIYKELKNGMFDKYQKVCFNGDKIARMAGDFFEYDGICFRAAQNCNERYGGGLVLQKVSFVEGKWIFENVARYNSPNKKMKIGFHTFNVCDNIIVVDARGYWYSFVGPILDRVRNFF